MQRFAGNDFQAAHSALLPCPNLIVMRFLLTLACCTLFVTLGLAQPSSYVAGKNFKGYIFPAEHRVSLKIPDQAGRFTPSFEAIQQTEAVLLEQLRALNIERTNQGAGCPVIHRKMKHYTRQYVGLLNRQGERVIWVNFVHSRLADDADLSEELHNSYEGCSYFWEVNVNIERKEAFGLRVNAR